MRTKFVFVPLVLCLIAAVNTTSYGQTENTSITLSISTRNNLSLEYLRLSTVAYENNSFFVDGLTQFEGIGQNPSLEIAVNSGNNISLPSISEQLLAPPVYFLVFENGSRHNVLNIPSAFLESSASVNASDGTLKFAVNLTDEMTHISQTIFPNATIDNIGVRGAFEFDFVIENFTGSIGQERFFSFSIYGNSRLSSILCDFTLPTNAYVVTAKNGEQDMEKIGAPYRVGTTITEATGQPINSNIYIEWTVPSNPPIWTVYPYNILLTAIISAIISLVVGAWIGRYSYEWIRKKRESHAPPTPTLIDPKITNNQRQFKAKSKACSRIGQIEARTL